MKTKIFLMLSLVVGVCCFTACDDEEDYKASSTVVVNEVTTGSADVTANSATVYGTVSGSLEKMADASYSVGFYYGTSESDLSSATIGTYESGNITAEITGLENNTTICYQAYVCLQNVTYITGEVKQFTTTNAKVTTVAAKSVGSVSAIMGGTISDYPEDAICGVAISTSSDTEDIRAGLMISADQLSSSFEIDYEGLIPSTTYYYTAYLDLGSCVVYGSTVESFTTEAIDDLTDDDFVDLGLSVKWMKYNLGSKNKSESDLGGLYAYGDLTGMNNSIEATDYASENIAGTEEDIVYVIYSGAAQLPTAENFEELFTVCTSTWTTVDGVYGCKFTNNGNSIFLPAAGSRSINDVTEVGEMGYYLTGEINTSNSQFAISYQCGDGVATKTTTATYQALSVRGVMVEE